MAVQRRDNTALFKFGLVGCGQIGSLYDEANVTDNSLSVASALLANPKCELVAVCDNDIERAQSCANARGVKNHYQSYAEMFAQTKLDAIAICTPPNIRYEVIKAALDAGIKTIWCEKPIAESLAEAQKIAELLGRSENTDVTFAVNYLRRWLPATEHLKDIIESNLLGKTRSANLVYGKGLANNASHFIELMNYFYHLPSKVAFNGIVEDGRDDDPTIEATITYGKDNNDFTFKLQGTDYRDHNICELDIILELGRIKMLGGGAEIEIYKSSHSELSGYTTLVLDEKLENATNGALSLALDDILSCAQSKKQPKCTLQNGIDALAVVEQIRLKNNSKMEAING